MPWDVLLDALLDTLKIIPFLFIAFILISVVEDKVASAKFKDLLGGKLAPMIGASTGVVPVCGFSVMAAKLYQTGCITLGTLTAIFISSSDEAVILLLTGGNWQYFLLSVLIKALVGAGVGYAVGRIFKEVPFIAQEHCIDEQTGHCCHCGREQDKLHKYLLHPLLHCAKTGAYVLLVNVVLGLVIYFVGEDNFTSFIQGTGFVQPVVAALVGLIPNCAASAAIVGVFDGGGLCFGGLVAGLITNAGLGLAIVAKDVKNWKKTLLIILTLFTVGVAVGELTALIEFLI